MELANDIAAYDIAINGNEKKKKIKNKQNSKRTYNDIHK